MRTARFMKKLSFAALLTLAGIVAGCKEDEQPIVNIKVDGLSSITGNWSSLGITTKAAMELAEADINEYFAKKGSSYRLITSTLDTKLETEKAVAFFNSETAAGSRFFIGPQSSAELAGILPVANTKNALVISQGSTAGTLAIAGDPIFRFCPADKIEGAAIAKTIFSHGIKGLVTLARDDAGNKGLQTATGASFTAAGGETKALAAYGSGTTDFSVALLGVREQITALKAKYGATAVGVYLASFDECVGLFKQAAADPVLSSVRWYGGDGVTLSAALIADPTAAAFAVTTQFFTPTFGLPDAYKAAWEPLAARIKAKTNIDADAFGIAAYDAMWVIAKTVESQNGIPADINMLKTAFIAQANSYTGATGPTTLDSFGDRANGSFDYWGIAKSGTAYQWKFVAKSI